MKSLWQNRPFSDFVTSRPGNNKIIKGKQSDQPCDGLVQGFSASGPDVWVAVAEYNHPGVVISAVGARCGKTFPADGQWTAIANTHVLLPGKDIDPRWLWYRTNDEQFWIKGGSAQPFVKVKDTLEQPILVPPLAEQQRIVGVLDEAMAGIATARAHAETNHQNARALFESHLHAVFTQRGPGWVEMQLENALRMQPQNGWSPPAANHADAGTPVLTLSSVTGFVFRPNKLKYTSAKTDLKARYWIQNGDFLITRSNTPELVGHVAIASGIERPTIYPDLIMRMNPDPTKALTEFLYYQLRTPVLREEITGRAQGANPTMKKISNGAVRTLPISLPPLSEQRRIVTQLDALSAETQRLAALYERKLAALEELKKSLLHQAFAGEL